MGRTKTTEFIQGLMGVQDEFPELGRREILLCRIFSDDITVTDDCKQEFVRMVVDYFTRDCSRHLRDARAAKEGIGFEPLAWSNIGTDFWLACFDRAQAVGYDEAFAGLLLDVVINSGQNLGENQLESLNRYLGDMPIPFLAQIVQRRGWDDDTSSISSLLYTSFCDRLSEVTVSEYRAVGIIMRALQFRREAPEWARNFNCGVKSALVTSASHDSIKTIILANMAFNFTYRVILPEEFFTEEDTAWLQRIEANRRGNDRSLFLPYNVVTSLIGRDGCIWLTLFSLDDQDIVRRLIAFNATERRDVVLLDTNLPCLDTKQLEDLPLNLHQYVVATLLGLAGEAEVSQSLFSQLLKLGIDDIPPRTWSRYIRAHIHEDARLESAFLMSRHASVWGPHDALSTGESLAKPFSYTPSAPMQALIQRTNETPISMDMLKQIRQAALAADEPLKTAILSLLAELINQGDYHEDFRFE